MLTNFCQYALLLLALATNLQHVGGFMVESLNGEFVPWSFVARAAGDGIGVRLKNINDVAYLASVQMGTPPQIIEMAPSLSQNQISVASPPSGVKDGTFYNSSISTSYVPGTASASITTISGGSILGHYAGELCVLQSATSPAIFPYNASVVLTDPAVTNDLYPLGARAVLGYGVNPPADSPPNATLIGTFLPTNFTAAVCGIELNHHDDPVPDGILTMGAVDPDVFIPPFTNVQVPSTSTISWSIPFDNITFTFNGAAQSAPGSVASIDIYHQTIQLTNAVASQIYAGVPGSKPLSTTQWSVPCNSSFPITITFAGRPFTIYERDTILKQSNGTCIGVVTGGAQAVAKIGAPFLRNVYTQFGVNKTADGSFVFVGFALKNLRQNTVPTQASPTSTSISKTTVKPTSSTSATLTSAQTPNAIHSLPMLGLVFVSIVVTIFL